jgi:hypothetical protein
MTKPGTRTLLSAPTPTETEPEQPAKPKVSVSTAKWSHLPSLLRESVYAPCSSHRGLDSWEGMGVKHDRG